MLTFNDFRLAVQAGVPRFQQTWLDIEQERAVSSPLDPPLFIVAGPGAGKTTVLALRVLKMILVDGIPPESIVATTFTRKAATELRSRLLSWGANSINQAIRNAQASGNLSVANRLRLLDINRILVGTLDSLAEQLLVDYRLPGSITPATIEGFLARGLLRRHALFLHGRHNNQDLAQVLNRFAPHFPRAYGLSNKLSVITTFLDRARHDEIDLQRFAEIGAGERILVDTINDYLTFIVNNHMADFARLEQLLLERLRVGHLRRFVQNLRAVVVDEFQDTNYLQEQIYFELARQSSAALTVVGDDDQSIFRFRGATIEIFASLDDRIVRQLGPTWRPSRIDLSRNYRSTPRIVSFCDHYLHCDPGFQAARVPGKIRLSAHAQRRANVPILGLFRQTINDLSVAIADLLENVFRGNGVNIQTADGTFSVTRADNGDFGDGVLLGTKVRELSGDRPRLPLLLRQELSRRNVEVFNPRGRSLRDIPEVQQILGLALECIDPGAQFEQSITTISRDVRAQFIQWRQLGQQFARTDPDPGGLQGFVQAWQSRQHGPGFPRWPTDWPSLELIFTLATWFPSFQVDPEGQIYLEAITRTIAEVGQMGSYGGRIVFGQQHERSSIIQLIRSVFESIADESVDVDEEIMPRVPRSYFPLMTVHQAKGLEFPLVLVDVGSDYRTAHHSQLRFRVPSSGDQVHVIEDETAQYCPIGPARLNRTQVERAWDDIRRLHFVALSRPHDVLLLVGLTSQLRNQIPSISMGDISTGPRQLNFVPAANWTTTLPVGAVALI